MMIKTEKERERESNWGDQVNIYSAHRICSP